MRDFFRDKGYNEWKQSQIEKAQDDRVFIDPEPDSQYTLTVDFLGQIVGVIKARVEFNSDQGWFVLDRCGRRWAIDTAVESNHFELHLRDHVRDVMKGIGWQRD